MTGVRNPRWPLRYRLAHKLHCKVNWLYRKTGKPVAGSWLNAKAASLWVPWWMDKGRFIK